jgi:hypothetical protein
MNRRRIAVLVAAALIASVVATTAHAQSNCAAFDAAIEQRLKSIAMNQINSVIESSAMRQTSREGDTANHLHLVALNLTLMIQNKCPISTTPLDPNVYFTEALACRKAQLGTKSDNLPACDFATWKGQKK